MYCLLVKIFMCVNTLKILPQVSSQISTPISRPLRLENCSRVPPKVKPPNLSNISLEKILSAGIFQMNYVSRNSRIQELESTFVFGEVGLGKSVVFPMFNQDLESLGVGLSEENLPVIFRDDMSRAINDSHYLKTIIPSYHEIHREGPWSFWDFPGFGFSNDLKSDIAQTYFLKHAIEMTKSARFIFSISYNSVLVLDDLRNLATYATAFIKNVSKFRKSIGLIVTEVDFKINLEKIEASIQTSFELFIDAEKETIQQIQENDETSPEIKQLEQRIDFIDGLLYGMVSNARGPVQPMGVSSCRPVGQSDTFWKSSYRVYSVGRFLRPSKISLVDFGYTINAETLYEIEQVLQEVDFEKEAAYASATAFEMSNLLNKLLHENGNGIPKITMLNGYKDTFDRNFGRLFDRTRGLEPSWIPNFYEDIKKIDVYMTCASQRLKTIQFLQDVTSGNYEGAPFSAYVSEPFQIMNPGLEQLIEYFKFCDTMYYVLGEPKNQLIIEDTKNKTGENYVNNNTVLKFLQIAKFDIPSTIIDLWEKMGYEQQQYLVEMVQNYVPEFVVKNCDFIGKYIFISKVFHCNHKTSVVAKEKVYFDENLETSSVSVVAPVWEVVSSRTGYRELSIDSGFFGVYYKIINSNQLFIRTTGHPGSIYLESFGTNVTIRNETSERDPSRPDEDIYKPTHGISNYIAAFEGQYLLDCHSLEFQTVFWKLRSNPEFNDRMATYTPIFLVNELEELEGNYSVLKSGDYNLKCPDKWKTLSERVYSYYDNIMQVIAKRMEGAEKQDELSFRIIGTFVYSRILNLRRLEKTLNVISTESYLAALLEDLAIIEKLELKSAINEESHEYQDALNEKVKEAESLIGNTIQPAIQSAEAALKSMNIKMLGTINAFIHAAEEHEKKMKDMRDEFKKMLPWKHVMSVLTMVGTAVTLLAPPGVGQIVGAGLIAGANIGNSFLDGQVNLKPLLTFTDVVADAIDSIPEDDLGDQDTDPELKFKAKDVANAINLGVEVLEGVVGCVNEIINNENKLDELDKAVKDAEAQVKVMENMKNQFENQFAPMLNKMAGDISGEKLNGTSQAGLTVKKFQMKNKLKGMRKMVHSFVGPISEAQNNSKDSGEPVIGEPAVYENFLASIETLEEALVVLFEMYSHIENYQERKEFAQFIANINNPTTGIGKILDEDLRLGLQRLERGIRTNLILEEYKKAEHAVKQFVFPFGRDYLMKKNHQFGLTPESTLTEVVEACSRGIREYLSIIQKYNAITTFNDQFVFYANFTSRLVSSKPFFVWRNDRWNTTIHRLFNGSSIQLMANCNQTGYENEKFFVNKTAIKFKEINIYLRTHDKSRQEDLNEVLKSYQMSMTHSGVSLYLVNRKQFVMRDSKQTYRYNFEGHSSQNLIRYKVTSPRSDFLMSPYTWWTLQIRDLTGNGFNDLFEFATEVDLELEGTGLYLDEEIAGTEVLNELHVEEYYSSFEPLPEVNGTLIDIDNTTESPHHNCSQGLLSNIDLLFGFGEEIYTSSNETNDEPTTSVYDEVTEEFENRNVWSDRFEDFQEIPKTRFPGPPFERSDIKRDYSAMTGDDEAQAGFDGVTEESQNRNVWSDRFEDFQQIPKPRFREPLPERLDIPRDYVAMTGEDEARPANNEETPAYEMEPEPANEEERETTGDDEERKRGAEEYPESYQNPNNNFHYPE